jgi:ornithine cyclodeaminase/alanine dehydrogenase-like protein (mu-crystallin family)
MKEIAVRYLSDELVRELLPVEEALKIIEGIYEDHGTGKAVLSTPSALDLKTSNTGALFKIKGAYVASSQTAGFRLIGLTTSYVLGLCYLCHPETSLPIGVVNESWLYLLRSGLSAAVAAKHLANPDSNTLGLLGCGKVAPFALEGLKRFFPLRRVRVHSRSGPSRIKFAREMEKKVGVKIVPVDSPREAMKEADIVITLTGADEPLVRPEWLEPGSFICSMGDRQELDPAVLDWADKLVVDDFNFCLVLGDIAAWIRKGLRREEEVRGRIWADMGEVVARKKPGRETRNEKILGIMQGMASCDIALAKYVFDKAVEHQAGTIWNL